jgi:hypothetical protein
LAQHHAQIPPQTLDQIPPATVKNAITQLDVEFTITGIESIFKYELALGPHGGQMSV